jgi:hypothetical protein
MPPFCSSLSALFCARSRLVLDFYRVKNAGLLSAIQHFIQLMEKSPECAY